MSYEIFGTKTPSPYGLQNQTHLQRSQPIVSSIVQPYLYVKPSQIVQGDIDPQHTDYSSTCNGTLQEKIIRNLLGPVKINKRPIISNEKKTTDKEKRPTKESDSEYKRTVNSEPSTQVDDENDVCYDDVSPTEYPDPTTTNQSYALYTFENLEKSFTLLDIRIYSIRIPPMYIIPSLHLVKFCIQK